MFCRFAQFQIKISNLWRENILWSEIRIQLTTERLDQFKNFWAKHLRILFSWNPHYRYVVRYTLKCLVMMAWLNISPIRTANFGLSPIHNEICFIKWNKMAPQFPALRLGEISPNRTTVYNIKINLSRIFPLFVLFPLIVLQFIFIK